jgi:5-oxopent-3-ene-1,2,5-tricarboxylate decarboxylase/2-hydroxyhepta-2,4-diene-1,7-dioate isomerase
MRLARFIADGRPISGTLEGTSKLIGPEGKEYNPQKVTWLPPTSPTKIIGLVLNYADHADELGLSTSEDPIIFIKPNNTLIGHLGNIVYPKGANYVHYEAELVAVMGRRARYVAAKDAPRYIKGYTIGNDVTVRDFITNTFRPPVKAKGFDTFCPLGPCIVTPDEIGKDVLSLDIKTLVNSQLRQEGNTRTMMHPVPKLIEFLTSFMTLEPDDIILTGTPRGISRIVPGDEVEISIDGLGSLRNNVVNEEGQS